MGNGENQAFGPHIEFHKVQGCGNDFVAIDNRKLKLPETAMAEWTRRICRRAFGVHADGLFFLKPAPAGSDLDYAWDFYNSDGSRAEMCGNASRCAARLAHHLGMAPKSHVFGTDAGPVRARVFPGTNQVKVQLTRPEKMEMNIVLPLSEGEAEVHYVVEGVPHVVVFSGNVRGEDVKRLGKEIRFHERFRPAGTNVNFVEIQERDRGLLRTYERGVESETYACGTGAAATLLVARELDLCGDELALTTSGGEILTVSMEEGEVFLKGAAEVTFTGSLFLDSLGLFRPPEAEARP